MPVTRLRRALMALHVDRMGETRDIALGYGKGISCI